MQPPFFFLCLRDLIEPLGPSVRKAVGNDRSEGDKHGYRRLATPLHHRTRLAQRERLLNQESLDER
jgi:hypothetical protein